jgi:hypothetical protein
MGTPIFMELMGFIPVFLMEFPVEPSTNGKFTGLYECS